MLDLLVFVPCEKVIISQDENNPTLIAVVQELSVEFQRPAPTADLKGVIIPMRWSIFAMWRTLDGKPEAEAKRFSQIVRIVTPSGKELLNHSVTFTMEKPVRRVIAKIPGIPATGESGTWRLELYIHEAGTPIPSEPFRTYPLDVRIEEKVLDETANV